MSTEEQVMIVAGDWRDDDVVAISAILEHVTSGRAEWAQLVL